MRTAILGWAALPLALLLLGAAPRPASANVLCDLSVSDKSTGSFGKQVQVATGQKFFIRVAVMNTSAIPLVSVCDIPGLKIRVGGLVMPWSVRTVLLPRLVAGTTIAAVCNSKGTFKTTVLVRFLNPYTGTVSEVADHIQVVAGGDDKKNDGKGKGGKDDKKIEDGSNLGELGGTQTGGTGGQQTGGTGGQQTGGTGSQTGGTGGQTGALGTGTGTQGGGTGTGTQTGGTGTQTGGTGGKKDPKTSGGGQQTGGDGSLGAF